MTKKILFLFFALCTTLTNVRAQGWKANYDGVMLQGFYWDSFDDTQWKNLREQADDLAGSFSLVWIPQSGKCAESWQTMGYTPYYYFNQNSSFGTEEELRDLISTLKAKGVGTIADVVVNHHNTSGWFSFPVEVYKGVTYQFKSTDITANDDGGNTAKEAAKQGVTLSSNNDEGEDWGGMRDLDHKSANVQNIIKAYVKYLKDDLGYTGFRYDMVKGFAASHVADYNKAAGIEFSVGEYWDSNSNIKSWIENTGKNSAAFDFQFRYNVRDAANSGDWSKLNSTNNLMHDPTLRQYAVTFIENHDTEYRSASSPQDPIKKDTLAANAYLIAMPGTPCVFLKHWQEYKDEIGAMISARRAAGITNMSNFVKKQINSKYYAVSVGGKLYAAMGDVASMPVPGNGWTKVLHGYHYAYYLSSSLETAFVDKASGIRNNSFKVRLYAVSDDPSAKVVYTTDGTEPTPSSSSVTSGSEITVSTSCTLKAGLLKSGKVTGVITRNYIIKIVEDVPDVFETPAPGYTFHAWFVAPATWKKDVMCWAWTSTQNYTGGTWPGVKCFKIGKNGNQYIWQWCYYGDITAPPTGIIFSNSGSPQTADFVFSNGAYYNIDGKTTGIGNILVEGDSIGRTAKNRNVYSLDGRLVRTDATSLQGLERGVYIYGGRKIVVGLRDR